VLAGGGGVPVIEAELDQHSFPSGSMGPKIDAVHQFVRATGRRAAIGALDDLAETQCAPLCKSLLQRQLGLAGPRPARLTRCRRSPRLRTHTAACHWYVTPLVTGRTHLPVRLITSVTVLDVSTERVDREKQADEPRPDVGQGACRGLYSRRAPRLFRWTRLESATRGRKSMVDKCVTSEKQLTLRTASDLRFRSSEVVFRSG
jgi:hypothetical protein